jgi:HEAT repeat protein
MMGTKEPFVERNSFFENDEIRKKVLIMAMGNVRDVDGLIQLLSEEENESILLNIINVIGALGDKKAIVYLESLIEDNDKPTLAVHAQLAKEVITSKSNY